MSFTIDQVHIDRVLTALQQQNRSYPLDEVDGLCPELSCDQVFRALDYLTQTGQVRLTLDVSRTYRVEVSETMVRTCLTVFSESRSLSSAGLTEEDPESLAGGSYGERQSCS